MRFRPLTTSLASLAVVGGLIVGASPATSAAPLAGTAGDLHAVVTAPVGGDWSIRFTDAKGAVLASVDHDAIALTTSAGRVPADQVLSVDGDAVELGTADAGLTATVTATPDGDGIYGVTIVGHGDGITATSIDLAATKSDHYLGLGERSDAVDHRGDQVQNRVLDGPYTPGQQAIVSHFVPAPGYSTRTDATYFPVPWILSTRGYGVLVDNDEDSSFELATTDHPGIARLVVDSSELDLRVFDGPTPAKALARMTQAVGRQPAPSSPMVDGVWWQPVGDAATELVAQRKAGVPVSVAQTYTHFLPCGVQQNDRERALTQSLHDQGVAVTTYFNPMVCQNYTSAYDEGLATNAFTLNADGTTLVYKYQTSSSFQVSQIDFSSTAGRDLFEKLLGEALDDGYDGWMEDFGEYTPDDAVSADGTPGTEMHNRYVEQYHATARDLETKASRPLLRFERSGWTGAIPNAAIVWGGDPTTEWGFDGLQSSVRQGLTMGTSGISVWGPDIGGYFTAPNEHNLTPELLDRWIEYGAFTGVMRLQSGGQAIGVLAKRAQVTDPKVAPVWKRYSILRTMLYPYISAAQDDYQKAGLPLMRQLALVYPTDTKAVITDDEYMFGDDLLVAPITAQGATSRKVYLPKGKWVQLAQAWSLSNDGRIELGAAAVLQGGRTVTAKAPLNTIPLFVRAGAALPMLPRTVDTLSTYGDKALQHLADVAGRRSIVAMPLRGTWRGALGSGETLTSTATARSWTLRLGAARKRTYDVQATLSALPRTWSPCGVTAAGKQVKLSYDRGRRVLTFSAPIPAKGQVVVNACR